MWGGGIKHEALCQRSEIKGEQLRYIHHHPYPKTHPFAVPVNHHSAIDVRHRLTRYSFPSSSFVAGTRGSGELGTTNLHPTRRGKSLRTCCCCCCIPGAAGLAAKKLLARVFCILNEKADFWEGALLLGEEVLNMGAILDVGGTGDSLPLLFEVSVEKSRSGTSRESWGYC